MELTISYCNNDECPDIDLFGVRGEYGEDATHCPKCGSKLSGERRPLPEEQHVAEPSKPPAKPTTGPFRYVASFRDYGPAQLARSRLEHEGFDALVLDEHIISLHWLYSQATFGFKLVVAGSEPGEAERIISEDQSSLLAEIVEMDLPASSYDACPSCGSNEVSWPTLTRKCKSLSLWTPAFVVFVLLSPVAAVLQKTRCRACGHKWRPQWGS